MSFKKLLNRGIQEAWAYEAYEGEECPLYGVWLETMVEWGKTLGYSREDVVGMVEEVHEGIRKTL